MNYFGVDVNDNYIENGSIKSSPSSSVVAINNLPMTTSPLLPTALVSFATPNNNNNNNNLSVSDLLNDNKDNLSSERLPDADSMKMFVGQVPRDWSEEDCRTLFEPYGDIYSINILKDKNTKESKGCCFVTYYTRKAALDAQNALHNLKKLPSCRNPIQMKPADNENKNDRKLFVGKLPKFMKEQDIIKVFSAYGIVEDCAILRDNNGVSKGCAFVTFSSRSNASTAIRALNQTKTLEGCTLPIVVKFADSNSNKETRKPKNDAVSPVNLHSVCPSVSPVQSYMTGSSLLDSSYMNLIKLQQQHQQQQQQQQQQQLMPFSLPYLGHEMAYSNMFLAGTKLPLLSNQLISGAAQPINGSKFMAAPLADQLSLSSLSALGTIPGGAFSAFSPIASRFGSVSSGGSSSSSRQTEGPDGANLFIYHLPSEYGDADLINLFAPFGNVISAKVFIDKNSNLSKCFGFVSYDNSESAQAAIKSMNGFQVLNKRLKVQLKKVRDKPY